MTKNRRFSKKKAKIAEVRHDHAAPEALSSAALDTATGLPPVEPPSMGEPVTETELTVELLEIHEVRQERLTDISWSPERRAAEELFSKVVPIREEEIGEHLGHPSDMTEAEAFEAEVDELDSTGSLASVRDLAPEIEGSAGIW